MTAPHPRHQNDAPWRKPISRAPTLTLRSFAVQLALGLAFAGCGGTTSKADSGGTSSSGGGSAGSGDLTGAAFAPDPCETDVQFAAPAVEAAVRLRLAQPEGPLDGAALLSITDLSPIGGEVNDLGGVECLTNLKVLWLHEGELKSLAPLAGLAELASVSFSFNQVTSLAPLNGKPKLRVVSASDNAIETLDDLELPMAECGELNLVDNPLSAADETRLQHFCDNGWWVSWGELGDPSSCHEECTPRP